jgi:hypothetical protein
MPETEKRRGRPRKYATDEERKAARKAQREPYQPRYYANRVESEKGKLHSAMSALYIKSDDGRVYNQLTALIAYRRRVGQPVDDLVEKRKLVLTLGQWKKTPAGIAALIELTKEKK